MESKAAVNLLTNIPNCIKKKLTELVRLLGCYPNWDEGEKNQELLYFE